MDTTPRLRFGVLGCADVAVRKMMPAMQRSRGIDLVAVASRSKARAEAVAADFGSAAVTGYEALLERSDIHAVYIPLPPALHAKWIGRALDADKHVLAEKPLAMSGDEADALTSLALRQGLILMENFMFMHHRQFAAVCDLVDCGVLGEIRGFKGDFGFPPLPLPNMRYDHAMGGGALLDAGCYPLRAALHFLGDDIEVVGSRLRRAGDREVDIGGAALLSASTGITAQISFGMDNYYQCRYELWGSQGHISAERAFTSPPGLETTVKVGRYGKVDDLRLSPDDQAVNLLEAFARMASTPHNKEADYGSITRQAELLQGIRDRALVVPA